MVALASPKKLGPHIKNREIWDDVYPASVKEPEYHVFARRKKWVITVLVGLTAILPGLTFNMYLPALNRISEVARHHLEQLKDH